ncbi:calcium-binding protein [Ruixingdingia sedimenti]|uniref:Calcium-binding protein n=1 Tax=Ruixingdingia sedimenti TaxID=3073604 RepID=A0ABU1F411_9RHOB|nr:calcium-binding protein [Xinfangfangia sp. LG-4]MDR5651596.1 calcium-binding protein [Xinfangfangia sp. LG-4]
MRGTEAIVTGSDESEVLFGTAQDDVITALGGDDTIHGRAGNDMIDIGTGANYVHAGAGDDTVIHTLGAAQTLIGGAGTDTLVVQANGNTPVYLVLNAGRVDDGQLSDITGFEIFDVRGGDGDDFVSFGKYDDTFTGGSGNDTAYGGGGRDRLRGGLGDDVLYGGTGGDRLYGERGNDQLFGGNGNDTLVGGRGYDTLTGGAGADLFLFNQADYGGSVITDFQTGVDRIEYWSGWLGIEYSGQVDPAMFSVGAAVGGHAQFVLIYWAQFDETWLHWDDNGDDPSGGTYGLMRFTGNVAMAAEDLFLY